MRRRHWLFVALVVVGIAAFTARLVLGPVGMISNRTPISIEPVWAAQIGPENAAELNVQLSWLPDDQDVGRQMEPVTRTKIQADYLRAWLQWNVSYLRREPYGLDRYFSGHALDAAQSSVKESTSQGWKVTQGDLAHTLQLHFYSADGAIVAFTDTEARVAQTIQDASGTLVFAGEIVSTYDVVMFLEQDKWHVRQWVRTDGRVIDDKAPLPAVQTPAGFVGQRGTTLTLNDEPYHVTGINYYPKDTPWNEFWPNYDPTVIDHDFRLIRELGLNTVRVFVPFHQFGGPAVSVPEMEKLADLLARADVHGLKVVVTLFDFRTDYSVLLWASSDRHVEALLTRFRDHPAILAWDLQNEPNLAYPGYDQGRVQAWLAHTARLARATDPYHLLTIGWSTPTAAQDLTNVVDFVSYHFYGPADALPPRYTALRGAVPGKPLVLGEFGLPTLNSFWYPFSHTEAEQASHYAAVLNFLRSTESAGYLAWTLYDFEHVPDTVAGSSLLQTEPQKHYGILRGDGTPKPAARLVAPSALLEVDRSPPVERYLKPFWLTVLAAFAGVLLCMGVGIWWWLKRLTKRRA